MKKKPRKSAKTAKSRHSQGSGVSLSRVAFEPSVRVDSPTRSKLHGFAGRRRKNPTRSEKELERILNQLNGGVLRGKFKREHPISGKWIVDFFFPEIRLAIEVDGSIHTTDDQLIRDWQKDADCAKFDITVLRIANREVWGSRGALIEKLRTGWRDALTRKNRIIGMDSREYVRASGSSARPPHKPPKGRSPALKEPDRWGVSINRTNIHLIDPRAPKPWARRLDEPLGSREDFETDRGRNRRRR